MLVEMVPPQQLSTTVQVAFLCLSAFTNRLNTADEAMNGSITGDFLFWSTSLCDAWGASLIIIIVVSDARTHTYSSKCLKTPQRGVRLLPPHNDGVASIIAFNITTTLALSPYTYT